MTPSSKLNIFSMLALFWVLIAVPNLSNAQSSQRWVSVKVGQKSDVVITPGESTKVINFAFFSTKKSASTLNINLTAPKNSRLTAKSLGVSNSSSLDSALDKLKVMHKLEVAAAGGRLTSSAVVGASVSGGSNDGSGPGGYRMMCDGQASSQFLPQMIQDFKDKCLRTHRSEQDLCDGIFRNDPEYDCRIDPGAGGGGNTGDGGGSGGSSSSLPTLTATSHVFKDACASAKYVVVLSVDLTKISSSQKAAGYTMSLDLIETIVSGNQPATLKMGDGKYKTWILLAPLVSFGNKHGYQVWSSSKSAKRLISHKTESMKKYYGIYGISIAAKQLRGGGRSTVAVYDTQKNYGLCVRRALTRQCINGYKGGDCK